MKTFFIMSHLFLLCLLSGCTSYKPRPLNPVAEWNELQSVSLMELTVQDPSPTPAAKPDRTWLYAVVGALRLHQQARLGIGTHELRVAGVGHRGGTALGGDGNVVLLLELVQVLLLQVDLACCLGAGRDERQGDGGGKAVETALIHWRIPLDD